MVISSKPHPNDWSQQSMRMMKFFCSSRVSIWYFLLFHRTNISNYAGINSRELFFPPKSNSIEFVIIFSYHYLDVVYACQINVDLLMLYRKFRMRLSCMKFSIYGFIQTRSAQINRICVCFVFRSDAMNDRIAFRIQYANSREKLVMYELHMGHASPLSLFVQDIFQ